MKIPIYQVDAFTKEPFKGNPAGVCILEKVIDDACMQQIAEEMNLSETAFLSPADGKAIVTSKVFNLRWFTPKIEVSLCGHATLGTSKVLFDDIGIGLDEIVYETKSGRLISEKCKEGISLDFPIDEPSGMDPPPELLKAMGIRNYETGIYGKNTKKLVVRLKSPKDIVNLNPNFELMKEICFDNIKGVGVTCSGDEEYDFISRYFNPWAGVNEDPVTGSVHTLLAAYWGDILKKKELRAYQASRRGGEILLKTEMQGRVKLIGESAIVLKGTIYL
ncbi:MAG: PhzF family phenazine biosynthesis protein [Clostridiaceae bacterium]